MRIHVLAIVLAAACDPVGTSAVPRSAAPSTLVRGDEGINVLMQEACGKPCEPLPTYARSIRGQSRIGLLLDLDTERCRVPGFHFGPQECTAVCRDARVENVLVDFGPIGRSTRLDLCLALEAERGAAAQGSCDEVCVDQSCSWPETPTRAGAALEGSLQFSCAQGPPTSDVVASQDSGQ